VKRGDLVTIALSGDYGKPRPALVIQSDLFDVHPSIMILPVTSELREAPLFRVRIEPTHDNGLRKTSEVMVDKTQTIARRRSARRSAVWMTNQCSLSIARSPSSSASPETKERG